MQESSKVNVKLTSKDIRSYSINKSLQNKSIKSKLFITVFFTTMFIFTVSVMFSDPLIYDLRVKVLLISIPAYLFIMAVLYSPMLTTYIVNANNYKKSPLLQNSHLYIIMDEGIACTSSYGIYNLKWSEIRLIQEFKSCLAVSDILGKCFIIPKRCFDNVEHLNNFIRIIFSKIDRSKLKLSATKFSNFSPENEASTVINQSQTPMESDESEPFSEIKVLLNKKELLKINYKTYYTSPQGIILTALGLLFLISFIKMLIYGYIEFITLPISLFMGSIFTFLIPVSSFFKVSSQFKKSELFKNPYTYKFYSDYFTVSHPCGNNQILWSKLVKAKEQKSSIMLYTTTQEAYIIPKSAFQDKEEQLKLLKKVILEKVI